MNIVKFFKLLGVTVVSMVMFAGCSSKDSSNIAVAPDFSVKPLENSSIPAISSKVELAAISCTAETNYWNEAARAITENPSEKDYVIYFYAQSNFYDCNARQQADETAPVESQEGNFRVFTVDINSDDGTRFISWAREGDSDDIQGKLVNLIEQDDGINTKTRIDLVDDEEAKQVDSLLYGDDTNLNVQFYTRAKFEAIKEDNGEIAEHYVGGRYYISGKVVTLVASAKKDLGISVFKNECVAGNANASCPLNSSTDGVYYNADGDVIDKTAAEALGLTVDPSSLLSFYLSNFFVNEDEFFATSFTPQ